MSRIGPDQQRLTTSERGNLVAYLDGELNEAEAQAIATKLTHSATARREIEILGKTWELLEHLPRPLAPENFTERTLNNVRIDSQRGDRLQSVITQGARRTGRAAFWAAAWLVAFAAAFAAARWGWPDPSSGLVRDLPLAEHLDEYREVGDFEFLNELAASPEFSSDRDD